MVGRGGDDPVKDAQPLLNQALGQMRRGHRAAQVCHQGSYDSDLGPALSAARSLSIVWPV